MIQNIIEISSESTLKVRNAVLRPNQPVESCHFDGDNFSSTHHFGYLNEDNIVGIISVFERANPNWSYQRQLQIRGMAVLQNFQKRGIGEQLVTHAVLFAKNNNVELIWMNARKNAVPFYEKSGFHTHGTAFEIEGIGTHFLMYRQL